MTESPEPVQVALLDGFEVRCSGERVALPPAAQRLVAFLALRERPLARLHVAGVLWLEGSEERSCANLRSALWRLRLPGHELVEVSGGQVGLAPAVAVDVRRLVSAARGLLDGDGGGWDGALDGALTGELLPDWYEDWVLVERERLHQLQLHALERLSAHLLAEGRFGHAAEAALAAVRIEPLRESAHRALIEVHLAEGNYGEAVLQYRAYRDRLGDELGLGPSPRMEALFDDLR
jgi:DNA-binding SARP family transcriptional activator